MTDLNARLDTITESLEIAARPQQPTKARQENDVAAYIEWHDAVLDILDATPLLVAALRAVLGMCDDIDGTWRPSGPPGGITADIRELIAAALETT